MIEFIHFLAPFLAPLPMGVLCMLFALFCVILRLQKTAVLSLVVGLGIFIFFGYGLVTREQLYKLERSYQPFDVNAIDQQEQQKIKFVVVLGSSQVTDPSVPETGQLDSASLYRLVEGIHIQRLLPQAWLVFSGGTNQDSQANAAVVGRVAKAIGVDGGRMIIEDSPGDTFEEAKTLQPMLKEQPFVLVTSAVHMKRAMKLFEESGMRPIAAPTDFLLKDNKLMTSDKLVPSCSNMMLSQQIIHEWLGNVWSLIRNMAGI